MRKAYVVSATLALLCAVLFLFFCDLGQSPVGPDEISGIPPSTVDPATGDTIALDSITGAMRIFISQKEMRASNTDTAEVTVMVYDPVYHNPLPGQAVFFRTTHGTITALDTTDINGVASATMTSVPVNADARVSAWMILGGVRWEAGRTVPFVGLTIRITTAFPNALVDNRVPVSVEALDAAGLPVSDADIFLTGALTATVTTGGDGKADTSVVSSTQTTATIVASGLGTSDTATVGFWSGSIPVDIIDSVGSIRSMRIFSSKSQLDANNTDAATITVILVDENNNPAENEDVKFTCDLGVIGSSATVDSTGRASVTLRSSPINGICTVRSWAADRPDTVSIQIAFSGVSINLSADPMSLKIGQYSSVVATLLDASASAIGGDAVTFTAIGGQFESGDTIVSVSTDPAGHARINVTSGSTGTVKVRGTALNSSDTLTLTFTTNACSLWAVPASIQADGISTTVIYARYVNGSGNAISGASIAFATNAGSVSPVSAATNANGIASTVLTSATFATGAIIQATAPNGSALDTVYFYSAAVADIRLAVTPDNISYNGGEASLIATVTDAKGNMVSGVPVNFKILQGPGGGEYIKKPVVTTQDGIATSTLVGGSLPSSYRGCQVAAFAGAISDTTKLTISGEPYIITVSRPEDDTVTVPGAGNMDESTFEFNVGAVVQDINGNPVADNTEVHFSAVVSGMAVYRQVLDYWSGIGGTQEIKAVLAYSLIDVVFEDINNNVLMDKNIDLMLDYNDLVASRGDDVNGDGKCDYNPAQDDFFFDFNGNGRCDVGVGEPVYTDEFGNIYPSIFADLNQNGLLDLSELSVDHNGNGIYETPSAGTTGDFRFALWEMRPMWRYERFDFENNDFAVVIDASAPTKGGVAYAKITYPRQMARRLIVTINGEANGIRDKDGERFVLPVIKGE